VVGVGQGLSEVHLIMLAQIDFFFTGNHVFTEAGQRHGNLDGGAGLRASAERQLLVDHGENASVSGINGDDSAVHVAQRVNSSLANDRIFTGNNIAVSNVIGKRTGGEKLNVTM